MSSSSTDEPMDWNNITTFQLYALDANDDSGGATEAAAALRETQPTPMRYFM